MDVTVIVGTFGTEEWRDRGRDTALRTCRDVVDVPVISSHEATLAEARNRGADAARTEWLCFLDADDELAPGYFDAMAGAIADLRAPSVEYTVGGVSQGPPVSYASRNIVHLNPCVIGTLVRRDLFHRAGGFLDEPIYEDWSLWLRCVQLGATINHVTRAVYRAELSPEGRNSQPDAVRRQWYKQVQRTHARGMAPA